MDFEIIDDYLTNNKYDELEDYLSRYIPDYLYKFYSLSDEENPQNKELNDKKIKTLEQNENWFDFSRNQNDPLDMKMVYFDENKASECGNKEIVNSARKLCERIRNEFLLCSFIDTTINNLPMWSAYANNHHGYCIKYKVNNKRAMRKVFYDNERRPIFNILTNALSEHRDCKMGKYSYILFMILSMKHSSWEHENEYRLLYPASTDKGQNISNNDMGIIPKDVYIGYKCEKMHKKRIVDICKKKLNCNCWQMVVSKNEILDSERLF